MKEQDDYDYGSGAPGALLRKSLVTYASLGNNITAFRQTVTICNGTGSSSSCAGPSGGNTGTVVAQTNYNYDEPNTLTTTSGIAQHASISGSRGNLTSINYPVSGLTSHFTYYDTGSPNTSQDINGATTTFNYSSNTASCQMAFPTSLSEPLSLSRSMTLNCTGGVATQVTDENSNNASISYTDPDFWRPASATDQTSATANLTYTAQTAVESVLSFNSGNSTVDSLTNLDSLGRPHVQQTRQAPGGTTFDSVESDYDVVGRPNRSTLPYSGTAGQTNSTAPAVTTAYDALGRPLTVGDAGGGSTTYTYTNNDVLVIVGPAPSGENPKRRQLEYNSIGFLTSVCEVTSGTGSGSCAQNNAQTGYWTKYTYNALGNLLTVTQNAQAASQQARTYTYDAMGRLLSEKNPETSQAASTYTYDSDSTCTPASDGDLVKSIDPVGNTTCYHYDALHRPTSVTYSGPYAANTPNKYLVYDSATVDSVVMSNAKTQLAEAYTATSQTGTKITDTGFSYSKRGEVTDVYESTPHSGGYYHLNQTYWPHGARNQLSGLPGVPTLTYGGTIGSTVGLDGEGRVTQVTAGSGQNPVSGVTYNTGSLPTQVTLGSGDNDVFGYDSNTLRMTQFEFNVGATPQSYIGKLNWNANGTLGQLAITDPFNSADNQTCNYAHDDLVRIASANCGSAAAQTFSYDPFGNIMKSGSPNSFQPTYNETTNQFATLPSGTPSYDANGNTTNDGNNTYTWNADGRPATINAATYTMDALGRFVEFNNGSSTGQIVYDPTGQRIAFMNGQTFSRAFVPLPGQGQAIYDTTNGLYYYRHSDWLGSARLGSTPQRSANFSVAYAPFGEPYAEDPNPSDVAFTGLTPIQGLSDFMFREYNSPQGRWPAPDPAGLGAVDPTNPQSWNRYAYVGDNPLSNVDPLGLFCTGILYALGCDDEGSGPCDEFGILLCGPPGSGLPCSSETVGCGVPPIFLPPIGAGGGGGGSSGQSGPTPIPAPPVDVGDPLGGTGPIWNEQIPIGTGPWNPFLIIYNATDGSVIAVGDYAGQQLCINGACLPFYWDPNAHGWTNNKPFQTNFQDGNTVCTRKGCIEYPPSCSNLKKEVAVIAFVKLGLDGAALVPSPYQPGLKVASWVVSAIGTIQASRIVFGGCVAP